MLVKQFHWNMQSFRVPLQRYLLPSYFRFFAFLFRTSPDLLPIKMLHFCSVLGPLETRHGNREFSGISHGGGGEFFDF